MRKLCHCGQKMNLGFRLVIFEGRIEIDRVPIYECEECNYYEVLPVVKSDLLNLLEDLRHQYDCRVVFTEVNEMAEIIFSIYRKWSRTDSVSFEVQLHQKCEERINLLLDLYSFSKDRADSAWMQDISKRLAQLSQFVKEQQLPQTN